jgi:hypothetical protein
VRVNPDNKKPALGRFFVGVLFDAKAVNNLILSTDITYWMLDTGGA